MLKRLKSKTYWLALVMGAITVIEANIHFLKTNFGDNYTYVYVGFSIVAMGIREMTKVPVGDK